MFSYISQKKIKSHKNILLDRFSCCKILVFQTQIIWSNRIHSLKYQRSQTLGSKDIEIRKVELVTKTQFLCTSSFCLQLTVPFHSFSFSMILIYSRSTSLFSVQKQNKKGFFIFPVSFGEFWKLQNKNCFGVTSLNSDHAWFCEFLHFFWQ